MRIAATLLVLLSAIWLPGCKKDATAVGQDGKVTLQLNWIIEPQFGGFYAAALDGAAFKKHGLNVAITPGGAGTPSIQMVGAGKADFGVASADEVVKAREAGNDVVALLAVFQDCPQGLMTRNSRGFKDIGDVMQADGTIAVQKGLDYWLFLTRKYGQPKAQVVPSPGGSITQFLSDEKFTQQCFITSEPLAAKKAGVEPKTFLIKEAGYNPYTVVLITRGDIVRQNPQLALKMATACREGWQAYVDDPAAANAAMLSLNPSMDAKTMADSAEVQKTLIQNELTEANGVGHMTLARWEELIAQLVELGAVSKPPAAGDCFVHLKTLEGKGK